MPPRIFAFGSNSSGQLGIGHNEDTSIPRECQFGPVVPWEPGETIQDFAAGGNHSLLLTSAGRVFAAGSNEQGQCGLGDGTTGCTRFEMVSGIEEDRRTGQPGLVTHIAATWQASFFVINRKRVYSCGSGPKGELGLGLEKSCATTPTLILDFDNVPGERELLKIEAGMSHAALLVEDGELFGWGASRKGQLGTEHASKRSIWSPTLIKLENQISSFAIGRDFTCLVDVDNSCQLLGDNKQLGDLSALYPNRGDRLFAGWTHLFVQNGDKLNAVGRNSHGQLPPLDLPPIKLCAVGSEHALALANEGRVVAWGWGEHGNCGAPQKGIGNGHNVANEVIVPLQHNELVSYLAAGCATSFVVLSTVE